MINLYSVYDKVAGKYNPPFVAENQQTAVRAFNNAMKNNPFKGDMALYVVGSFNDDTDGVITPQTEFICNSIVEASE